MALHRMSKNDPSSPGGRPRLSLVAAMSLSALEDISHCDRSQSGLDAIIFLSAGEN